MPHLSQRVKGDQGICSSVLLADVTFRPVAHWLRGAWLCWPQGAGRCGEHTPPSSLCFLQRHMQQPPLPRPSRSLLPVHVQVPASPSVIWPHLMLPSPSPAAPQCKLSAPGVAGSVLPPLMWLSLFIGLWLLLSCVLQGPSQGQSLVKKPPLGSAPSALPSPSFSTAYF